MIDGTNDGCWDLRSPQGTEVYTGDYAASVTDAKYCQVNLNVFSFYYWNSLDEMMRVFFKYF